MKKQMETIKTTFGNLFTIYTETATLLLDAESLMEKAGYTCPHGNTLGTEQSKNMNNPGWWITPYAARYFIDKKHPHILKGLGVFFVTQYYEAIEPLIIIASFDMKKDDKDEPMDFGYYYLRYIWFNLVTGDEMNKEYSFGEKWNFNKAKVMAIPLENIKDMDALIKMVIDPLVEMGV